jgi:hypothetical protein
MPNPNLYAQNQDQEIARLRAQRDAIRASLGVTGPGGGTTSARVFPDGRIEGAQHTPQAGYNRQGYKIPAPLSGAGGQANTPPTPYDKQGPPQPVDPRLEEIRKGTAYFEQRNAEGWNTPSQGTGNTQSFNGADLYNQSMALQNGKNIQGTNQQAFPASGKTKAQMDAEAIAPGRQPTAPYNGWKTLSPSAQKILSAKRGYTQDTFDAPGAAKARELAAKFPLSDNSFKNSRLLDQGIPMVGANAPPTQMQAGVANSAAFAGSMLGAGMSGMGGLPLTAMSGQRFQPTAQAPTAQAPAAPASTPNMRAKTVTNTAPKPPAGGTYASSRFTQKKGSHNMTGKQLFKLAFLSKCIEDGLTMEQMCERAKQALHFSEKRSMHEKKALLKELGELSLKGLGYGATGVGNTIEGGKDLAVAGLQALGSGLGSLGANLPWMAGAAAIGAPLAAGYYIGGPASYNMFSKPNLPTREEMMQEELLNEYEKQTKQLKQQSELAKRRKERSKGISGVTRY